MSWINLPGNGDFGLLKPQGGLQTTVSILAPAVISGTVVIGYKDQTDTFVPLTDGALAAGGQVYVRAGASLPLIAQVAGSSSAFSIFVSLSRD